MAIDVFSCTILAAAAALMALTAGQKECRSVTSINDYALQGHAYQSIIGKQMMTCVITCDQDPDCYSLNYRFPTSTCELNGETRASHPGHFLYSADSIYLEHLSRPAGSCSQGWPCKNQATCVNVPMRPGYKCYCKGSYVGELCQECSSPPLGLADNRLGIPDSKITGSSEGQWLTTYFPPRLARLNGRSSWVASYLDSKPWLQIDLNPKTRLITHIATQGSPVQSWWTTKYSVGYRLDWSWSDYRENSVKKVFQANMDKNTVVRHAFSPPFKARYVRVYPTDSRTRSALRVEFYGCTVF